MRLASVTPRPASGLDIVAEDGRTGVFDVGPYLGSPAFAPLREWTEFARVRNRGYYVEWPCGADLSADTIEARWAVKEPDIGRLDPNE